MHCTELRDEKVVRIACGFEHSLVSTEAGTVYAFGANNEGQLGIGTEKVGGCGVDADIDAAYFSHSLSPSQDMNEPVALGLSGGPLKSLSCGLHHSAAITGLSQPRTRVPIQPPPQPPLLQTADGKLMMWGDGSSGQLGLGNKSSLVPKQVKVKHAVLVSCGNYHTGVVTASGDAYMFGENDNGKLGLGPKAFGSDVTKPTKIASLPKHHIKALSCGANHTAFLTGGRGTGGGLSKRRSIFIWSIDQFHNSQGDGDGLWRGSERPAWARQELRRGRHSNVCFRPACSPKCHTSSSSPRDMPLPDLQLEDGTVLRPKAASVSCGQDGTAVVDTTGKVFVCGSGRHGKLGLEGEDDVFTPTPVAELALDYRVLQVACGGGHMLALTVEADDIEYSDEDPDELNGVEDELESLSSTDDDEEAEAEGAGVGGDGEEQEEAEVEVSGENGEGGEGEGGAAATAAAPLDPRARFRQNRPMLRFFGGGSWEGGERCDFLSHVLCFVVFSLLHKQPA